MEVKDIRQEGKGLLVEVTVVVCEVEVPIVKPRQRVMLEE